MEIIPVLDLRRGMAVSGKSGERSKYAPLKTVYCNSPDPIAIAENLPYERLYVADLDGIVHGKPDYDLLRRLCSRKKTMVDAGLHSFSDVERLARLKCELVLGTETLDGLDVLKKAVKDYRARLLVSVDIKGERVLSNFLPPDALGAVKTLTNFGVSKIILLNISAVGTMGGVNYELVRKLVNFPETEIIVGGGIRKEDVKKLEKIGVKAALIGTALHKGLLG